MTQLLGTVLNIMKSLKQQFRANDAQRGKARQPCPDAAPLLLKRDKLLSETSEKRVIVSHRNGKAFKAENVETVHPDSNERSEIHLSCDSLFRMNGPCGDRLKPPPR
jgi:hypothetical protein